MKYILILIFLGFGINTYAQWEFNYFVLKAGANHHMLSKQPEPLNSFFLHTVEGDLRLMPDSTFFPDYVPGFQVGLNFHFDFPNDKGGVIIGAEYLNQGVSSKYTTIDGDYYLIQTHRINSVSLPLMVKFGKEIFDQQKYFFAGIRFNVNFGLQTIENVSWTAIPKKSYAKDYLFVNNNIGFVAGFNFLVFNFEFDFYPLTFLDKLYSVNVGTETDKFITFPYANQPDKLMFLQTNLYIPISSWTTSKSYFMHNIMRNFK